MNLFHISRKLNLTDEVFESILEGGDVRIERILSRGQVTPEGEWYDQELDEWVVLLQGEAEIAYDDGRKIYLNRGDSLFLPAGKRHRVSYTSEEPVCIWLAVHGRLTDD